MYLTSDNDCPFSLVYLGSDDNFISYSLTDNTYCVASGHNIITRDCLFFTGSFPFAYERCRDAWL